MRTLPALVLASCVLGACGGDEPPAPVEPVAPVSSDPPAVAPPEVTAETAALRTLDLGEGLSVEVLREGSGRKARRGSEVAVHYQGSAKDAETPFVTTRGWWQPARWVLDARSDRRPLEALARALEGLAAGAQARVHVPAALAYGSAGLPGAGIEQDTDLVFVLELVEVH